MTPTPTASVIIACRNAEATLGVQLEALVQQECPVPWNVIISDNGSTDRTVALARSYADRLPGLVVVDSAQRAGAGHARNVGARATGASILLFCDADDEVAPLWLASMVAAVRADKFVAGRFEGTKLNHAAVRRSRELQQDHDLQHSPFGPDLPHAGAGNLGVTRQLFFAAGGFDPGVGSLEDTDLSWRIQLAGAPLVFHPEAVVHVRLRSSLKTMWAQGRAYGGAAALLEHRYAAYRGYQGTFGFPSRKTAPAPVLDRALSLAGSALTLIRAQRSLGGLLWTVGWHVGHRRWHEDTAPALPRPLSQRMRAS